jgi:hypothetical protein
MSQILLMHGGHTYSLAALLKIAGTGPVIEISEDELNPLDHPEFMVKTEPPTTDIPVEDRGSVERYNPVILLKQQGKYTMLVGEAGIAIQKQNPKYQGKLKGRLVTSVMLKRIRLDEPTAEEVKPEPSYPAEFSNRPVIRDHTSRNKAPDRPHKGTGYMGRNRQHQSGDVTRSHFNNSK